MLARGHPQAEDQYNRTSEGGDWGLLLLGVYPGGESLATVSHSPGTYVHTYVIRLEMHCVDSMVIVELVVESPLSGRESEQSPLFEVKDCHLIIKVGQFSRQKRMSKVTP